MSETIQNKRNFLRDFFEYFYQCMLLPINDFIALIAFYLQVMNAALSYITILMNFYN